MRARSRLSLGLLGTTALAVAACSGTGPAAPGGGGAASPASTGAGAPPSAPTSPTATLDQTGSAAPETPPGPAPNIVLLLTDDQTLEDLSAMPGAVADLGSRGTTFTRALAQYPLCAPGRATLLTGQLAHNHGVLGNDPPWGGYGDLDESQTLPVWLQRAGYRTGLVGKYVNGYPVTGRETAVPPGWSDWASPVVGPARYYDYTLNVNGRLEKRTQYQSDFVGSAVSDLVEQYAADEAPFFVWAGFFAPHYGLPVEPDDPRADDPLDPVDTPAVEDDYRGTEVATMPVKPSRREADRSDKVRFVRKKIAPDLGDLQEFWAQRRESLRSVDDAVLRVLDTLERTGELDETLVVLTSDNGYLLGEHGINQKIFGYEESIRVPLLMAGPGVAAGVRREQLVGLTDVPATFLDAAGAKPGVVQDGISLLPLSQDPAVAAERTLLLEAGGFPFPRKDRLYTGVRTPDDRVLLRWYNGFEEVYDLGADPYQLDGRVSDAEAPGVDELRRRLDALVACAGEGCSAQ